MSVRLKFANFHEPSTNVCWTVAKILKWRTLNERSFKVYEPYKLSTNVGSKFANLHFWRGHAYMWSTLTCFCVRSSSIRAIVFLWRVTRNACGSIPDASTIFANGHWPVATTAPPLWHDTACVTSHASRTTARLRSVNQRGMRGRWATFTDQRGKGRKFLIMRLALKTRDNE